MIGNGAFGQVAAAVMSVPSPADAGVMGDAGAPANQVEVAIKKLTFPFESPEHAKRTFREIAFLRHLQGSCRNKIIRFVDVFTPDLCVSLIECEE